MRAIQEAEPEETDGVFQKASLWKKTLKGPRVPELEAHEAYMRGTAAVFQGNFQDAMRHLELADDLYRTQCPGQVWELTNVRGVLLNTWSQLGRYARLAECAQGWIEEAVARGDAFARATYIVAGFGSNRHLMNDMAATNLAEIEDAMLPWRGDSVAVHHFTEAFAMAWGLAYAGGEGADSYWELNWPRLSKSFLFRMSFMREGLFATRLLTTLARACAGGDLESCRATARPFARSLRLAKSPVGESFGMLGCAQLALLEGNKAEAAELGRAARTASERMGTFYARPADVLVAYAEGAPDARDREQKVVDWFASEGWVRPEKALELILPVSRTFR